MKSKYMIRVVDDDIESRDTIVPDILFIYDFLYFIKLRIVLYYCPNTTWRSSWCVLRDVIWAPLSAHMTS